MTQPYVEFNDVSVPASEVVVMPAGDDARAKEEASAESVTLADPRRVAERAALLACASEATAQGRTADAAVYTDLANALHS